MISLREMDPHGTEDAEEYLALLGRAAHNPEVTTYLPKILEETSIDDVRQALSVVTRKLIVVEGKIAGRAEFTDHLNNDPTVANKYPAEVKLGLNTCYFINPQTVSRNLATAHKIVATKLIIDAFEMQADHSASPWLPVAPDNDPSRGWLTADGGESFAVHIDKPRTGWMPQYGIDQEAFHPAYASRLEQA